MAEGSKLQPSVAETRQVRLPQSQIASYPQSYPYLAQRQSNIGRNTLMAKGRRAVSRPNAPKVALTGSVTFGTLPTSRHDAGMRSDESVNYVKLNDERTKHPCIQPVSRKSLRNRTRADQIAMLVQPMLEVPGLART